MLGNQLKQDRIKSALDLSRSIVAKESLKAIQGSTTQVAILLIARTILVGTLFYMAWRFGGTETVSLYHTGIALLAVFGLMVLGMIGFGWRPEAPSLITIALPLTFIGYSVIQCLPISLHLNPTFTRANQIRTEFGELPAQELSQAATKLGVEQGAPDAAVFASVIPQNTRIALVPLMLAASVCILASLLFNTSSSRRGFLWALLLNTVALAIWGIIQRANGSVFLLPGIVNTTRGFPFSSFIYRNAGAAAILPGVAAAAALLFASRSIPLSRLATQPPIGAYKNRHYGNPQSILTVKDLFLITLGCVVVVGVVAALSRGAWIAGILSLAVAGWALRHQIRIGKGGIILGLFLSFLTVATAQVTHQIEAKLKRMSIEDFTLNERWSHWKDGLATAMDHFPFGSGLGTYGYATLLEQSAPNGLWFQEAHNQYLEVFTESGVLGILLLAVAIVWALKTTLRLAIHGASFEIQAFGLFGLLVLVCATVQSTVDFVIAIPANYLLYACFFGMLGGIASTNSLGPKVSNQSLGMIGSCGMLLISGMLLSYCVQYSKLEIGGDLALSQTPIDDLKDAISEELINERIEILDGAIKAQPDRAALYRHRANYRFALYRRSIIAAGKKVNETISWENTQPEVLFAIIASLSPQSRALTISSLVADESMTLPLSMAINDIATGLRHNPLFGQLHLTAAVLSPIGGWATSPWIEHGARLSKSDPEKLYACGLLAFYSNDIGQMKLSWADCLAVSRKFDQSILTLSLQKLSTVEISTNIMPPSRPEVLITLVRTVLPQSLAKDPSTALDRRKIAMEITEPLLKDSRISEERRQFVAASIFEAAGDRDSATHRWLAAVEAAPKDANYRFKAADGLRSIGNFNEAMRHVTLGGTLVPNDSRFDILAKQIRAEIATSSK